MQQQIDLLLRERTEFFFITHPLGDITSPRLRGEVDFRAQRRKSGEGALPQAQNTRRGPLTRIASQSDLSPQAGRGKRPRFTIWITQVNYGRSASMRVRFQSRGGELVERADLGAGEPCFGRLDLASIWSDSTAPAITLATFGFASSHANATPEHVELLRSQKSPMLVGELQIVVVPEHIREPALAGKARAFRRRRVAPIFSGQQSARQRKIRDERRARISASPAICSRLDVPRLIRLSSSWRATKRVSRRFSSRSRRRR